MVKKRKEGFESFEAEVVRGAQNFVKEKIKKKIMKWSEFGVLVLLSLIMISFGIATLIGSYYPQLDNGLNFVVLGMIFLVMGMHIRM